MAVPNTAEPFMNQIPSVPVATERQRMSEMPSPLTSPLPTRSHPGPTPNTAVLATALPFMNQIAERVGRGRTPEDVRPAVAVHIAKPYDGPPGRDTERGRTGDRAALHQPDRERTRRCCVAPEDIGCALPVEIGQLAQQRAESLIRTIGDQPMDGTAQPDDVELASLVLAEGGDVHGRVEQQCDGVRRSA